MCFGKVVSLAVTLLLNDAIFIFRDGSERIATFVESYHVTIISGLVIDSDDIGPSFLTFVS